MAGERSIGPVSLVAVWMSLLWGGRHPVAVCSAGGHVALDEGGIAFVGGAADAVGSCRELKVSHAGDIEF